ncbi:hypothetical protein PMIN04_000035 [Paraphaeosphaeria minitans]
MRLLARGPMDGKCPKNNCGRGQVRTSTASPPRTPTPTPTPTLTLPPTPSPSSSSSPSASIAALPIVLRATAATSCAPAFPCRAACHWLLLLKRPTALRQLLRPPGSPAYLRNCKCMRAPDCMPLPPPLDDVHSFTLGPFFL